MTDTNKILDKIRKLNAKAESCKEIGSEHEAQAFAQMVNKLLNEHQLEMTDLQFEETRKSEPVDRMMVDWKKYEVKTRLQRIKWIERLAMLVAQAHTCRILVIPGSSHIILVGTKTNREVAEYVLVTLVRTAEKIADAEYVKFFYEMRDRGTVERARGFRAAFLDGFVERIGSRFDEEKRRRDSNSTALVRYNTAAADLELFMKNLKGTKKATSLTKSRVNYEGYKRGVQKANDMDLRGNAVKSGNDNKKIGQ